MRDFAAGEKDGRFVTGDVAVEFGIGAAGAGHPFVLQEPERTRTDRIRHLLRAGFQCMALRHDEALTGAEAEQKLRAALFQADGEALVVQNDDLIDIPHQHLAEGIARSPAADGLGGVPGEDRFVVMEL